MKRPSIKDMRCDAVDVKPVDVVWTTDDSDVVNWEFLEALECEKCGALVTHTDGDCKHSDLEGIDDDGVNCDGYIPPSEGPMMNYYYPLPNEPADVGAASRQIAHLPLCLVHFMPDDDDRWALALTGGGMDLSWEICEAFMLLGYLPPVHFAGLPAMSGRGTSEKDRWIAAGCLKSCAVAAGWVQGRAQRLRKTLADARIRKALADARKRTSANRVA